MTWLLEFLTSLFRGQRGETRADFDSIAKQWESLSMAMNVRMTEAFTRMDRIQGELDEVREKEDECRKSLLRIEEELRVIKEVHHRPSKGK